MNWQSRVNSVRVVQSSNPLVGLLVLLAVLVGFLLAIPLIILGIALGIIALPAVVTYRWLRARLGSQPALGGRRNVRVIEPDSRER